jgi:hypothetical protein
MANVYYNPEAHDLVPVAEIDHSSGSYEFDIRVVWRHKDGRFLTARDSGCSCPTPFGDSEPEPMNIDALRREMSEMRAGSDGDSFIRRVEDAMRAAQQEGGAK